MGFTPDGAESAVNVFKESVQFVKSFNADIDFVANHDEADDTTDDERTSSAESKMAGFSDAEAGKSKQKYDRIPVRLSGGRKAWLEVPQEFYEKDKAQLKAQIEAILCDDEGET